MLPLQHPSVPFRVRMCVTTVAEYSALHFYCIAFVHDLLAGPLRTTINMWITRTPEAAAGGSTRHFDSCGAAIRRQLVRPFGRQLPPHRPQLINRLFNGQFS